MVATVSSDDTYVKVPYEFEVGCVNISVPFTE